MPKISVCIPAHNSELWIAESIESILNQTFQDFELLLLDDGSTDTTNMLMAYFLDKHKDKIRLFFYDESKGIANARNYLNSKATGEIIVVQDSDDYAHKERLEKTYKYFKRHKKIDLVYGSYQIMNARGEPGQEFKAEEYDFERLKKHNYIGHPTVAYRAKVINKVKYRKECKVLDDWFMYYDFIKAGHKIGKMDDILTFYRILPTSVSRSENKQKEIDAMRKKFLEEASENTVPVAK